MTQVSPGTADRKDSEKHFRFLALQLLYSAYNEGRTDATGSFGETLDDTVDMNGEPMTDPEPMTDLDTLNPETPVEDLKGDSMTATATTPSSSSKKKETKTKPAERPNSKFLGKLVAQQKAVRDLTSVATGFEYEVAIRCIVGSDNPRPVPRMLHSLGYKLVDPNDHEHSLIHLATSTDIEDVRQCVTLFEEHENDPEGHTDDDRDVPIGETASKSIVGMAEQFRRCGQLQAVVVRRVGKDDSRTLIFGQRRTAAAIYLHAKSRVEVADEVEGARVIPATIRAVERRVSAEEAYDMAVGENIHREDFSDLEEATVYSHYLDMINPETGKKYTLKHVARKMGVNQGRVRSYAALIQPRNEETHKGLTDEDRKAIDAGTMTITAGVRKALNEKHYSDGHRQTNRAKPIPLKEMQKLFDNTGESKKDRREAIAECMGMTLEDAITHSEKRLEESEAKEDKQRRNGSVAAKDTEAEEDDTDVEVEDTEAEEDDTEAEEDDTEAEEDD